MLEHIEGHPASLNQGTKRSLDGSLPSTPMEMKGKAGIFISFQRKRYDCSGLGL